MSIFGLLFRFSCIFRTQSGKEEKHRPYIVGDYLSRHTLSQSAKPYAHANLILLFITENDIFLQYIICTDMFYHIPLYYLNLANNKQQAGKQHFS